MQHPRSSSTPDNITRLDAARSRNAPHAGRPIVEGRARVWIEPAPAVEEFAALRIGDLAARDAAGPAGARRARAGVLRAADLAWKVHGMNLSVSALSLQRAQARSSACDASTHSMRSGEPGFIFHHSDPPG